MRDSKDHATLELPGLMPAVPEIAHLKRAAVNRPKEMAWQQVQLELLEPDDLSNSPVWRLDQSAASTRLTI
jgi:hypothetical protein